MTNKPKDNIELFGAIVGRVVFLLLVALIIYFLLPTIIPSFTPTYLQTLGAIIIYRTIRATDPNNHIL